MGENTNIEWATHTWNPWIGCSHAHTGCDNCYAEAMAGRFGVTWGPHGTRRRTNERYWRKPLKWERAYRELYDQYSEYCAGMELVTWSPAPPRPRIFPSLCDPFEGWPHPIMSHTGLQLTIPATAGLPATRPNGRRLATMADLRRDMFALIHRTPHLDWLLLTKRPENVRRMWCGGRRENVWLIYSASDQATLEAGLPHLLACRYLVPVLGLSLEPLLGPVNLGDRLHWVIVGGESGPHGRPCNIEWIRSIVRQCKDAGVPCFTKQLGAKAYMEGSGAERFDWPYGYTVAGGQTWLNLRDKKGGDVSEWPEDLRVREFPR